MKHLVSIAIAVIATVLGHSASALAQANRPNILVIFGDDIGINNISAYGRHPSKGNTPSPGQAVGRTPAVRRDYQLEYYEDGYPKLPSCLDRRPRRREVQKAGKQQEVDANSTANL